MGLSEIIPALTPLTASYVSYVIGSLISLVLFLVAYQTILHPLSNYPGPFPAKLTDGYGGYYLLKKRLHLATYHDHLKYGPVFRSAPNRLVFNTVTALHDIYLNPNVNKARIYNQTQFNKHKNIFGTLDRDRHKHKRKVYGQVLSSQSLRIFEPIMSHEIDIFLQQLLKADGSPINMSPQCERLTADIAGQLAFGQPLHTQTQEKNRIFPKAMTNMNRIVGLFMAWPLLGNTWPILRRLTRKNGRNFNNALQSIIKARMELPKEAKHDFYSIALNEKVGPGDEGLKRSEIWAEAVFILPAGGTTVSTALSAVFFYLCRYPEAYKRLADEIRTTFRSGRDIQTGPLLSGCKYLRAVIDETLRVAPPFVGTFWREPYVDYDKPFVVDGHVIPKGVMVGVNPYCVMHNDEYFPEPFTFKPERWLGSDEGGPTSPDNLLTMRRAHAPFALGETGCLGKGMAYMETSLVVAKTLWYFDFETAPGETGRLGEGTPGDGNGRHRKDEYQLYDIATADHDGPNVVFKPREQQWRTEAPSAK
ncbi:hypothetical protein MFIFM68171_05532 [Madurella fahalii]|uniref:Cytochrome P450 n=1 Tax=Madurella fahalii TaxID=1157608 RepID=A0ABQ0GC17_9PEZI